MTELLNNKDEERSSQVALVGKNPPANAGDSEAWIDSLGWEDPLGKGMAPVFLPGQSHGQRNPSSYIPQGRKKSDTTEVT